MLFALEGATRWILPTDFWNGLQLQKKINSNSNLDISPLYRLTMDLDYLPQTQFDQPVYELKPLVKDYRYLRKNTSGYVFNAPNETFRHVGRALQDGQIIFDVEYNFDEHGRRKLPFEPENPFLSSRHLILSGCSFDFGEGLQDNETLAAQLQKRFPGKVYNLSRSGASVVDAVALMQTTQAWDTVEPSSGMVLAHFSINLHMVRFLGTLMSIGRWNQFGAFLEEDPKNSGHFRFGGLYAKNQPFRTGIGMVMAQSNFLKAIEFDWPPIDDRALENYARVLLFLKLKYQQKTRSSNQLVVYLHPGEEQARRIIPFLEKYGIYYLDYSNLLLKKFATESLTIPHEGHPSKEYNRILGQQITHDLTLQENSLKISN